jgi:hypothetical protein
MFLLRALKIVAVFVAITVPVLAQGHTSEQSEAQITGWSYPFAPSPTA